MHDCRLPTADGRELVAVGRLPSAIILEGEKYERE